MRATTIVVGRADDLRDGERMLVDVQGRSVVVIRQDGRFYGLLNRCPHKGADLCAGRLVSSISSDAVGSYDFDGSGHLLACPWHGWEFDIRTGRSFFDPDTVRVRHYEVDVLPGDTLGDDLDQGRAAVPAGAADVPAGRVPGLLKAETVEVTVEGKYLVVSTRPARPARSSDSGKASS